MKQALRQANNTIPERMSKRNDTKDANIVLRTRSTRDTQKQALVSYVTTVHDVLKLSCDIWHQIKLLLRRKNCSKLKRFYLDSNIRLGKNKLNYLLSKFRVTSRFILQ
jgi:DNA relaxase NicK